MQARKFTSACRCNACPHNITTPLAMVLDGEPISTRDTRYRKHCRHGAVGSHVRNDAQSPLLRQPGLHTDTVTDSHELVARIADLATCLLRGERLREIVFELAELHSEE